MLQSKFSLSVLFILAALSIPTEIFSTDGRKSDDPPVFCNRPIPGLDRMARGIDITQLDLLSTIDNPKDGFRAPVIEYSCNLKRKWSHENIPNVQYDRPDQISGVDIISGGTAQTESHLFKNIIDFKASLMSKVGINVGINTSIEIVDGVIEQLLGSFSMGLGFEGALHAMYAHNYSFSESTATVSSMRIDLEEMPFLSLSRAFINDLNELTGTYDEMPEKYDQFVKKFGTHYFSIATFGGLVKQRIYIKNNFLKMNGESKVNTFFKIVMSPAFTKIPLRANYSLNTSVKMDMELFEQNSKSEFYFVGGVTDKFDPTVLKNGESQLFAKWAPTVNRLPRILGGNLIPLDNLVQDPNTRKHLRKASLIYRLKAYFQELNMTKALSGFTFNDQQLDKFSNVQRSIELNKFSDIDKLAHDTHDLLKRIQLNETTVQDQQYLARDMVREVWKQQIRKHGKGSPGRDIIQMLSTLWIMGLMDEYELGKKWFETNYYSDNLDYPVESFVVSTEYMGSLLACFALTNDTTLLDKAKHIGDRLKVFFNSPTGLPYSTMVSKGKFKSDSTLLAEAGGQHLEFVYLADMTNDLNMKTKVRKVRSFLQNIQYPEDKFNLYSMSLDVKGGFWEFYWRLSDLYWPLDVFYQYLAKSYVQSNRKDKQAIGMYKQAMDSAVKNKRILKDKDGLTYSWFGLISTLRIPGQYLNACYLGSMLALGADAMQRDLGQKKLLEEQTRIDQHWKLANEITEMCHQHANKTKTKLPSTHHKGYKSYYEGKRNENLFWITSLYAESYFVLWRLTHDVKYRDYAWEMAQAIYKHCRAADGEYYELVDVNKVGSRDNHYQDKQELAFLVNTLKYLYLTFSEDSLMPLDQWVFNRVGQPLPICGKNDAYPAQKCAN